MVEHGGASKHGRSARTVCRLPEACRRWKCSLHHSICLQLILLGSSSPLGFSQRPFCQGLWACINTPLLAWVLGGGTGGLLMAAVASQLTADGAGTAPLQVGDGSHAPALLAQRYQCHPFFSLQMFVSRFHMRTLPVLGSVALRIGDRPFIVLKCRPTVGLLSCCR